MSFSKFLAFLFLLLVIAGPSSAQAEQQKRLVFFDVFVSSKLAELKPSAKFLSRALANELVKLSGIQVMDQGTRDSLLLQRKFNLDDCAKTECRFAMAKALPGIEYMLETEIEPFGKSCAVTMRIKSVKKGSIVSSQLEQAACEPEALLAAVRKAASNIHPDGNGQQRSSEASRAQDEIRSQAKAFLGEQAMTAYSLPEGEAVELPVSDLKQIGATLSNGLILYSPHNWTANVVVDDGQKKRKCMVSRELFCVIRGLSGTAEVSVSGEVEGNRTYRFGNGVSRIAVQESDVFGNCFLGSMASFFGLGATAGGIVVLTETEEVGLGVAATSLGVVLTIVGPILISNGFANMDEPPLQLRNGSAAAIVSASSKRPEPSKPVYTVSPTLQFDDDKAIAGLQLSF